MAREIKMFFKATC